MNFNLAGKSLLILGLSVLLLIGLTLFESALAGAASAVESAVTFLLLVLPPAAGSVLGVMSLARKEGQTWLAITGVVLNTVFALFHLALVLFAG